MMRTQYMKHNLSMQQEEDYELYLTTNNEDLFCDLHEAIDKVIEKHYAPVTKGVNKE